MAAVGLYNARPAASYVLDVTHVLRSSTRGLRGTRAASTAALLSRSRPCTHIHRPDTAMDAASYDKFYVGGEWVAHGWQ
jgi:hypothetical protein